jgi:peptidoglycan/xylan/chitin deacetylase (PgdA/CDA1 family)
MVLLRATRRSYNHDLASYQVDSELVKAALKEESQKKSFQQFEKDIKQLSGEMKKIRQDIKTGRSTSSDVFFPSTGSAGNITGNSYPARTWSITYDDGPSGKHTPTVLANLKNHGMKATFFQLAQQVKALPNTAKSVLTAGHNVACHSYSHKQLTKLGPQGLNHEIDEAKKVQEAALGTKVRLFRLPYGAGVSRANIRSKIAGLNMIHVFWNVDTLDWQDKNPQKILNRAVKQMTAAKNHAGVILFHDIHPQSVIASNLLMDYLQKNSFKVCTVQSVIDQVNKALPGCE